VECQWDGIPVPAVEDDSCGQGLLIECFAKLIDGGSMEGSAIQTLENLESISEAAVLTQLLEDLDDQCNFTRYGYEERCDDLRKRWEIRVRELQTLARDDPTVRYLEEYFHYIDRDEGETRARYILANTYGVDAETVLCRLWDELNDHVKSQGMDECHPEAIRCLAMLQQAWDVRMGADGCASPRAGGSKWREGTHTSTRAYDPSDTCVDWIPCFHEIEVSQTKWCGSHGRACVTRRDQVFEVIDYGSELSFGSEDEAGVKLRMHYHGVPRDAISEDKQCLCLALAGAVLWAKSGDPPLAEDVQREARWARLQMRDEAFGVQQAGLGLNAGPGDVAEYLYQSQLHIHRFAHDALYLHHTKNVHCLAVLPVELMEGIE
jgi:hypothetical protein